jgi:ABC-type sulfate/molybdate transport systems ATPase subunit
MLKVDITKRLGEKHSPTFVLSVNFTVANGIVVLTGASGSGKTTTLRSIAGIITPDAGRIEMDERIYFDATEGINLSVQQRRVGFVFQDYALFPHLTAAENIAYGVKQKDKKIRFEVAQVWLALFHIEHTHKRLPHAISGGEQQRVALARALASEPALVLLDEPLSAVDVELRSKLLDDIVEAQAKTNIPFIYVTHNETEAMRLSGQHLSLKHGQLS